MPANPDQKFDSKAFDKALTGRPDLVVVDRTVRFSAAGHSASFPERGNLANEDLRWHGPDLEYILAPHQAVHPLNVDALNKIVTDLPVDPSVPRRKFRLVQTCLSLGGIFTIESVPNARKYKISAESDLIGLDPEWFKGVDIQTHASQTREVVSDAWRFVQIHLLPTTWMAEKFRDYHRVDWSQEIEWVALRSMIRQDPSLKDLIG